MKVFNCVVMKTQLWTFAIESEDEEEAKEKAEHIARHRTDEDAVYSVTAKIDDSAKPSHD